MNGAKCGWCPNRASFLHQVIWFNVPVYLCPDCWQSAMSYHSTTQWEDTPSTKPLLASSPVFPKVQVKYKK